MKFWRALLKNKQWISEDEKSWNEIKDQIIYLEFHNDNQIITLPKNADYYIQGKTCSSNLSTGKCEIESRFFGFSHGNIITRIRINEKNNNISIEDK